MYRVFDAAVACDFPLPGLPETGASRPDILIELGQGGVVHEGYDWLHTWREEDGEEVLSCARLQDEKGTIRYLLRFPDLADFEIAGITITCHPYPDCHENSLCHLLLDQVLPRLWAHLGHLVLHASAVRLPGNRVVAFVGESGWGKSTLAAALQAYGGELLCDDCLSLVPHAEGVRLIPSYAGLRLNNDSISGLGLAAQQWTDVSHYSQKRRFEPTLNQTQETFWLEALYLMAEPIPEASAVSIVSLSGAGIIPTLIKRSFLLDVRDTASAARQLNEAGAVLRRLPRLCSLAYPRSFEQLETVCDAVLNADMPIIDTSSLRGASDSIREPG